MANLVELITVPDKFEGGTSEHLEELVGRIAADESVTLNSNNEHFVCFTVEQDALDELLGDLQSKLIVEVNQSISAPEPTGPYSNLSTFHPTPSPSDDS